MGDAATRIVDFWDAYVDRYNDAREDAEIAELILGAGQRYGALKSAGRSFSEAGRTARIEAIRAILQKP